MNLILRKSGRKLIRSSGSLAFYLNFTRNFQSNMDDFRNRLSKVYKHISKWARKNDISCFRIYDWDIPGHPLVIDRYGDYLHIAEYRVRHSMEEQEHMDWWEQCIKDTVEITGTERKHIFIKKRQKLDRRQEQYDKFSEYSFTTWQQESGLQFKINLTDYLDTGLFLDHRPLRIMVRDLSKDKKVLNLFSYTGSFSVYSASGGAASVTTVDLSNTYIQWARDNFERNGLPAEGHQFIVSDVMQFLKEDHEKYDLIIVDPPSFSNSKKMKGTWDTQRDHRKMLSLIAARCRPGAIVFFSNNLRTFQPDFEGLDFGEIEDISMKTIPEDFRNKKIHYCFRLTH